MGGVQLLPKHGNTIAKPLLGSSRAHVNQTIDFNDSSFRGSSAFSHLGKTEVCEAFPGDGAVLKLFAACQGTGSEDSLLFPLSCGFASFIIKITTNFVGFLNCKTAC